MLKNIIHTRRKLSTHVIKYAGPHKISLNRRIRPIVNPLRAKDPPPRCEHPDPIPYTT